MALTISAWLFSVHQIETRIENRFFDTRDRVIGLINDRMVKYEDTLRSGVAAIHSHGGDITFQQWSVFANTLHIEEKYPGINGIGVIHYQEADSLDDYLRIQRQTRPDFEIYPRHVVGIYMPITYIEPLNINAAAVGLDVAHEVNRRTAALAARDTGKAQITGPIVLVQDETSTPGFLFYVPFYSVEAPTSVEDRQRYFRGAVYAPFVVHKLMQGLLAHELRDVRVSIRDADSIIFDEHLAEMNGTDPDPMFTDEVSINMYGRAWVLDIRTDLRFREANTFAQPTIILIAGLVVEALIVALLFFLSRANRRAINYARKVTGSLRDEKAKLAKANKLLQIKNEEMEQFAYIASHDLKTPIRGIGGLAEMIEEDLGDYFTSQSANPDVARNLSHIQDRVRHMNELTKSILNFSQITAAESDALPLKLEDAVADLRADFGLELHQLTLSGDVETVVVDASNFRRVLENLVSNAIKYHDGKRLLQINLSARSLGPNCEVKVSDNGPGISEKFHRKIFDIFQTLQASGGPESTGIGLAIVRKAVNLHGGQVTVTSTKGEGATFTFDWPLTHTRKDVPNAA
ncbi:Periplasmic sensor signal transduction histidine kinase [Sulfitobacter noctilucicola]|nr:Periplasmic sensor signal transduction histidine kinase [Sulfitobacter noctilucicola]